MSDDKTEEPTDSKVRKAREDGQVSRSADFTGAIVMFAAGATTWFYAPVAAGYLMGFFRRATDLVGRDVRGAQALQVLSDANVVFVQSTGPILLATFAAALFVNYIQVGALLSLKAVSPDLDRLNPAKGIKNVISKRKLTDLGKNVVKLTAVGWIGTTLFLDLIPGLTRLPLHTLQSGLAFGAESSFHLAVWLASALLIIAIVDLVLQRRRYMKDLMMTKQEIKDEHKQSEGDPHVKSQRKRLHQQLLQGGGTKRVKNADAVVVNPTRIAVALMYDETTMEEPEILARGMGDHAQAIRRAAIKYGVPIVENVDLARALYQVDDEVGIPPNLYDAVAEVLSYVYSLRREE
ncbi:MAG: EscU/YscU/HrcU family type III secretion system export apparatus switch protein [bacterium]